MCGIFLQVPRIIKAWQIERTAERRMAGKTAGVRKGSAAGGTSARQTRGSVRTGAFFRARFCRIVKGEKTRRRQAKRRRPTGQKDRRPRRRAEGRRKQAGAKKRGNGSRGEVAPAPAFRQTAPAEKGRTDKFLQAGRFYKIIAKIAKVGYNFLLFLWCGRKSPSAARAAAKRSLLINFFLRYPPRVCAAGIVFRRRKSPADGARTGKNVAAVALQEEGKSCGRGGAKRRIGRRYRGARCGYFFGAKGENCKIAANILKNCRRRRGNVLYL